MADNDNTITVVGRIGQEPELRTTAKGQEVLNFSIATNERRRAADGTWSDGPTSWFRIAAWGTLARNAQLSFHRGQRVVVHGVLRVNDFQQQGGGRSQSAELRATALGHDLTWGTSTFVDAGRAAAQQATMQAPEREREPEREPERETVPPTPPSDWGSSLAQLDETPF
jgi:single-strand DNA-binding protein